MFARHFGHCHNIAADVVINFHHLPEARHARLHHIVRQQNRKGFVANHMARTPNRVAEAERLMLAREV